jgi:hypothetical protein
MWWMPAWLEKRLPHLNIEPPDEDLDRELAELGAEPERARV